jgi:uncharacterized membrane protein
VIVTFVARSLRPSGWFRSASRRIRRGPRWDCSRWCGSGVRARRSRSFAARRFGRRCGAELGRGLAVVARRDEQDSSDQEQPNAEDREPQRRRGLWQRGRRVMVVVVVIVVLVLVGFVVIAVAAHAVAYFRFFRGGQADLGSLRLFGVSLARFAGLTLLGPGP